MPDNALATIRDKTATECGTIDYIDLRDIVAGVTGLEPAASCVTGRRSNQAELHPRFIS